MENIEKKLVDVVVGYLRSEAGNITREKIEHVLDKAVGMLESLYVHVSGSDREKAYEKLLKITGLYVSPSVITFKTSGYKVKVTAERDGEDATLPFLNHLACAIIDAKHHAERNHLTAIAEMYRDEFSAIYRATHKLEGKK